MCHNKYNGIVTILPEKKLVEVDLTVQIKTVEKNNDELKFYLYNDTSNLSINSNRAIGTDINMVKNWSPYIMGEKEIKVSIEPASESHDDLELNFSYILDLRNLPQDGMNQFNDGHIELGVYIPWFPLSEDFNEATFSFKINMPDEYILAGGNSVRQEGQWQVNQQSPFVGYTIMASKHFGNHSIRKNITGIDNNLFWVENYQDGLPEVLHKHISDIITCYSNSYGSIAVDRLDTVIVPRDNSEQSGGYCRPGLIVLPGGENTHNNNRYSLDREEYLIKYVAHEIGHLWWSKADMNSFENWLNESFAEYASLVMMRELYCVDKFNEYMKAYRKQAEKLSAIVNTSVQTEDHFDVWRIKGPVILNQLEDLLGSERFNKILYEVHGNAISTTEGLIKIILEVEGEKMAIEFDQWLRV